VYDVQWSPIHPSIFASCDGDGFIDIWDINKDKESPIVHTCAFEQQTGAHGYKEQDDGKALGAIKWSRDGRRIAVGDSEGFVSIW
jgi:dynein intermediate chain, cytosolic